MLLQDFHFDLVGPKINEQSVAEFEKEIGGSLGDGFKAFLLEKNGGVPTPELTSSLPKLQYKILTFYELSDGFAGLRRAFVELVQAFDATSNETQALLPIAIDSGGREICISTVQDRSPVFLVLACLVPGEASTRAKLRDLLSVQNQRLGQTLEALERAGEIRRSAAGWQRVG